MIDSVIGYFSPSSRLRRETARLRLQLLNDYKRKYDGADRGRRTENWLARGASANVEIERDGKLLRDRARDMVRNHPYAARGIQVIANNVIGDGIKAHIRMENDAQEQRLRDAWKMWALSTEIDYDARNNLAGLQTLALRAMVESGEVIIRRRKVRRNSTVPMKIQILEPDYLPFEGDISLKADNGNDIYNGIEYDASGRRVAYHLYKEHPGDRGALSSLRSASSETVRVPASEILHLYRIDRAGQSRGVTWLAPVMLRMKDFKDYEDAQLLRQKIAACFTVFVRDTEVPDILPTDQQEVLSKVEPGTIELLPPGKDVTLANPPDAGANYDSYTRNQLRAIASGLGVSYEALTGDLSNVNFSSARMGWLEFQRNIESWRNTIINPVFNSGVWSWFKETAAIVGLPTENARATWVSPRREMIDPTKEIPAKIKSVRAGFETLSDVILQNGKQPDEHFEELHRNNVTLDEMELTLDTDPRRTSSSGLQQSSPEN